MKILKASFLNLLQAAFALLFMGGMLLFAFTQQALFAGVGVFFLILMVITREAYKQVSWPGRS